jgi:transcriptional regulator GlxA family with amidase domain
VVCADALLGGPVDFDLVLVVAGGDLTTLEYPRLACWLRLLAARGVLIGGVSGGPLLLARAGIMDGRRMTVHWDHAQILATLSTKLIIERSLYVRDRDRLTCAGGAAPLDMMHALICEHHGAAFAQKISDWFLHTDIRPGENAQRSGIGERYSVSSQALILSIEAMENHLADPLELSQLASLAGIGVRQLNRLFRSQLDASTMQLYRHMRLSKAQVLLKSTSWSLDEISAATGFANGAHLSRQFSAHFDLSPRQFRQQAGRRR